MYTRCSKRRSKTIAMALVALMGFAIGGQLSLGATVWMDAPESPPRDEPQVQGSQGEPEPATPPDAGVPLDEDRPAMRQRGGRMRELDPGLHERRPGPPGEGPKAQRRRGPGMGRGFQGEGRPPRGWLHRLPDEERQRLMHFIEEHFPMLYLDIERRQGGEPGDGPGRLRRAIPEMLRLMDMMETDPQRGTLMIQERRIAMEIRHVMRQYRSTREEENRARLRVRLRELCTQAFDVRHQRRELEIQELEIRLNELKQRHVQTDEMRDELIDQAVKDRLDRAMDMERRRPCEER